MHYLGTDPWVAMTILLHWQRPSRSACERSPHPAFVVKNKDTDFIWQCETLNQDPEPLPFPDGHQISVNKSRGGLFPFILTHPQFMQGHPEQRQDAKGPLMLMFGTWVWRDMAGPQPSPSWTFVLKLHSKKGLSADTGISAFRFFDENKVSSLGQLNYFLGRSTGIPCVRGIMK